MIETDCVPSLYNISLPTTFTKFCERLFCICRYYHVRWIINNIDVARVRLFVTGWDKCQQIESIHLCKYEEKPLFNLILKAN